MDLIYCASTMYIVYYSSSFLISNEHTNANGLNLLCKYYVYCLLFIIIFFFQGVLAFLFFLFEHRSSAWSGHMCLSWDNRSVTVPIRKAHLLSSLFSGSSPSSLGPPSSLLLRIPSRCLSDYAGRFPKSIVKTAPHFPLVLIYCQVSPVLLYSILRHC